jgi:hypothetical protein
MAVLALYPLIFVAHVFPSPLDALLDVLKGSALTR